MIKKAKNTAILTSEKVVQKAQVLELPNSDFINGDLNISDLKKYNLKAVTIVKGRNTVIEILR
jgi:hypothetical protein